VSTALVVIDMLNRYEHEDAEPLRRSAKTVVPNVSRLLDAAREQGSPVVYVNDNHGDWTAGRVELTQWALEGADPSLVEPIAPAEDVPLLLKARHSAFYDTQLEYLLRGSATERVILAGQVTEQCVLYTALDAHVRHFEIVIPADAVAHIHPDLAEAALRLMETNMHARVVETAELLHDLDG
jgi:nicotinamidase-related amidase